MPVERLLEAPVRVPLAIAQVLVEAGIDHVFGMPGGRTGAIFDALYDYRDRIRAVLVREEGLAAVMADVYGRLTGKPGVAMGQGAFLLTNAGMGIVEAFLAGSPVLLLSDLSDSSPLSHHAPYQAGTGDYGTWDAQATIAGYTQRVFVAREPAQAVQDTQLAIKHALSTPSGPVAVLFHSAALAAEVGPDTTPRLYGTAAYLPAQRAAAPLESVERAARTLRDARRPVILAGNGVRLAHAQKQLRDLAELLDVPVATTAAGKGVFPETHALALGVFGTFGLEAANVLISEADVVCAVGTKLGPTDTAGENPRLLDPDRQVFIQIDAEARNASWTFPAEHALVGDAGVVLTQLRAALDAFGAPHSRNGRRSRVAEFHQRFASFDTAESASDESPIHPLRLIKELHRALPSDAIVTGDAGENRLFMLHHFQTRDGMEYLQPAGVGGMGYAVPAALAAKLVFPRRPAVAVCGDGGFGIAMNGLLTAIDERIRIVVVVFDNGMLGWVRHGQGERPVASEFAAHDYAAIARAMGCLGLRVTEPLQLAPALSQALAADRPAVVDVVTSGRMTFRDVSADLSRLTAQAVV
ncbi:MAG: thiamine pyrophosphate-binding protein [Chloroflexi bacterium]|nr:thiamine pyrophosphate-binding protein [Chloroflexota bacterium]MBV9600367.1 thiamine pyrophosphate-binding protein [Chloroflexota bacterium]